MSTGVQCKNINPHRRQTSIAQHPQGHNPWPDAEEVLFTCTAHSQTTPHNQKGSNGPNAASLVRAAVQLKFGKVFVCCISRRTQHRGENCYPVLSYLHQMLHSSPLQSTVCSVCTASRQRLGKVVMDKSHHFCILQQAGHKEFATCRTKHSHSHLNGVSTTLATMNLRLTARTM